MFINPTPRGSPSALSLSPFERPGRPEVKKGGGKHPNDKPSLGSLNAQVTV